MNHNQVWNGIHPMVYRLFYRSNTPPTAYEGVKSTAQRKTSWVENTTQKHYQKAIGETIRLHLPLHSSYSQT